ncbi:MAG: Tetratricopeptide 2 repeat protein [Pedosphaera sp.]|nr:Tetratricopeptide 2 repeat protein [Pedosphaera sp.]
MESFKNNRVFRLICLGLVLGTVLAFGAVIQSGFISYDDPEYVTENPHVNGGTVVNKLVWAFTTDAASNWHPLTWISHMMDCAVYGLNPGGHHLTNLLFHIANSLLLFGILRGLTGATWRSGVVAALFAWHPLHVESVAWVAERKDVLSTFFWLLTIGAYARYVNESKVRGPKARVFYGLALGFFVLGLLSKPMVVTLPFVLLLLDYWPLGRLGKAGMEEVTRQQKPTPVWLLMEKAPFFILAAAASLVTFLVQQKGGAVNSLSMLALSQRLINAVVSYARYLRKMIWPNDLAIFYPRPSAWPAWEVAVAVLLLLLVTIGVVLWRRRRPYLLVGWFWYLGTLVPVIGLVQVGLQSMADRYTYIPLIGIFVMLVWGVGDGVAQWPQSYRRMVGAGTALILAACLAFTWLQVRMWHDSLTLFQHAIAVTTDNYVAHDNLGVALDKLGREEEAIAELKIGLQLQPQAPLPMHNLGRIFAKQGNDSAALEYYLRALKVQPDYSPAHYDLARLLAAQGKWEEAMIHFEEYLRKCSDPGDVHYNIGNLLASQGRLEEAMGQYQESVRLDPDSADAHDNLGLVLVRRGALVDAVEQFKAALRIKPNFPEAEDQLAGAYLKLGRLGGAVVHYGEAVRLKPDFAHAQLKLGLVLAQQGRFDDAKSHLVEVIRLEPTNDVAYYNLGAVFEAQKQFDNAAEGFAQALRIKPDDAETHGRLGSVLAQAGKFEAAMAQYREAIRLQPDLAEALRALAGILSTNAKAELRDGAEAVLLAERANELTGGRNAKVLTALDEAYAETGRFEEAIKIAQQVRELAAAGKQTEVAEKAAQRLELYRAGKAYHEGN